jgi:hypothetical protein
MNRKPSKGVRRSQREVLLRKPLIFLSWQDKGSMSHAFACHVEELLAGIEAIGFRTFRSDHPTRGTSGGRVQPGLIDALRSSCICLLFYTRHNLGSEFLIWEGAAAVANGGDVLSICIGGLSRSKVPAPHRAYDGVVADASFAESLLAKIRTVIVSQSSEATWREFKSIVERNAHRSRTNLRALVDRAAFEEEIRPPAARLVEAADGAEAFDRFEGEYFAVNAPLIWELVNRDEAIAIHRKRLANPKLSHANYVYTFDRFPEARTRSLKKVFAWKRFGDFFRDVIKGLPESDAEKLRFFLPEGRRQKEENRYLTYFSGKKGSRTRAIFYIRTPLFSRPSGSAAYYVEICDDRLAKNFLEAASVLVSNAETETDLRGFLRFCRARSV